MLESLVIEPARELRSADDVGDEGEPAPPAPDDHRDRRHEGGRHEREARRAAARVDEDRRQQRADDPDAGDDA